MRGDEFDDGNFGLCQYFNIVGNIGAAEDICESIECRFDIAALLYRWRTDDKIYIAVQRPQGDEVPGGGNKT